MSGGIFHTLRARSARATGGVMAAHNRSANKSPHVAALLPQALFDQLADEAHRRGMPLSHIIREAIAARYATRPKARARA